MASMSYCLFENTATELERCVAQMQQVNHLSELEFSQYENTAFLSMWHMCRSFLAEHERLLNSEALSK